MTTHRTIEQRPGRETATRSLRRTVALAISLAAPARARRATVGRHRDGLSLRRDRPACGRRRQLAAGQQRRLCGGLAWLRLRALNARSALVEVLAQRHGNEAIKRQPKAARVPVRLTLELLRKSNCDRHELHPSSACDARMLPGWRHCDFFPPLLERGGTERGRRRAPASRGLRPRSGIHLPDRRLRRQAPTATWSRSRYRGREAAALPVETLALAGISLTPSSIAPAGYLAKRRLIAWGCRPGPRLGYVYNLSEILISGYTLARLFRPSQGLIQPLSGPPRHR